MIVRSGSADAVLRDLIRGSRHESGNGVVIRPDGESDRVGESRQGVQIRFNSRSREPAGIAELIRVHILEGLDHVDDVLIVDVRAVAGVAFEDERLNARRVHDSDGIVPAGRAGDRGEVRRERHVAREVLSDESVDVDHGLGE